MPDTTAFEAYNLRSLFIQSARAVIDVQKDLDERINPAYLLRCQVNGHRLFWSVPRVAIDLRFGLQVDQQKNVLFIPLGKRQSELHAHHLRFSLKALPELPPAPGDAPITPDGPAVSLLEPYFLLPHADEERLCR